MSSLRAIVICQKYFGNQVISSQIYRFAPALYTRRCTLWLSATESDIVFNIIMFQIFDFLVPNFLFCNFLDRVSEKLSGCLTFACMCIT